jgi:hypothetical protein
LQSHAIVTNLKRIAELFFYTFQEYSLTREIERPPHNQMPERYFFAGFLIDFALTQFGNIFIPKGHVVTTKRALSGPFITVCVSFAFSQTAQAAKLTIG